MAPVVFDYWVGDDTDASIVVDEEGMLYVSAEQKRYLPRGEELGQLIKLDPTNADDPYVWGMFSLTESPYRGGFLATPALGDGVLYAVSNKGFLTVVDRETGEELWHDDIGSGQFTHGVHMSSPVVVDGHLLLGIASGYLRCYDLSDPRAAGAGVGAQGRGRLHRGDPGGVERHHLPGYRLVLRPHPRGLPLRHRGVAAPPFSLPGYPPASCFTTTPPSPPSR